MLIASSVISFALPPLITSRALLGSVIFAGALLILIFWGDARNRLFQRELAPAIALGALAVFTPGSALLNYLWTQVQPSEPVWNSLSNALTVVGFALTLIFVLAVARTRQFSAPWRYLPICALVVSVLWWMVLAALVEFGSNPAGTLFLLFAGIGEVLTAVTPILYGVLILVACACWAPTSSMP